MQNDSETKDDWESKNRVIRKPKQLFQKPRMIWKPKEIILKPTMIRKPRTTGNQGREESKDHQESKRITAA